MTVLIILIFLAIIAVAFVVLHESNDWPDDDHLEPPQGGAGGII